jgi:hypothetical protein
MCPIGIQLNQKIETTFDQQFYDVNKVHIAENRSSYLVHFIHVKIKCPNFRFAEILLMIGLLNSAFTAPSMKE